MNADSFAHDLAEHSERLITLIQSELKSSSNQSITFARFMELAQYSPGLGYYSAGSYKLGAQGDFVTAPEISPLFTHCIASEAQAYFTEAPGDFLELGAGSGIFAKEFITFLKASKHLPKHYYILETSAELRARQQCFLQQMCPEDYSRFVWLNTLPTHFNGMIFANEVLDALPIHCFRKEKQLFEKCVTFENQIFQWCLRTPSHSLQKQFNIIDRDGTLPENYESEINLLAPHLITSLMNCLEQGILLLFDYGYGRRELYHPERNRGTLKCFYRHQHHDNPFIHVGLQDITAHVDFTSIAAAGIAAGGQLLGYTTQSGFLLASGLLNHVEATTQDPADQYNQAQSIKTLTLPSQMGEIIKAIGFTKNIDIKLNGFSLIDRRRDL